MNSISISGKSWVLKKFNEEEISYIKENFFLDEITSKLLSIRKIKKEDINSFLNPSIKNFLPNPNNLIDMKKSTLRSISAIKNKETRVKILSFLDRVMLADGIVHEKEQEMLDLIRELWRH